MRLPLFCLSLALLTPSFSSASAQAKLKRITVLPLKDRTGSGASMKLSEKTADAILAKLGETGEYTLISRSSISMPRGMKLDADFNPLDATRNGIPAALDYIVMGQIDEFSASESSSDKSGMMGKRTEITGSSALKITLRVVATENGTTVATPSARSEKTVSFGKVSKITLVDTNGGMSSTDMALQKLVEAEIDDVSAEVATKIAHSAAGSLTVVSSPTGTSATGATSTSMAPLLPRFVGMLDGDAVINKGVNGDIKIGQKYDILHVIDTGLIDPDTNKPILKRRVVCRLVISAVDDTSSQGKCTGVGVPVTGDELREVMR